MKDWRRWLPVAAAAFALGAAAGSWTHRLAARRQGPFGMPPPPARIAEHLSRALSLDPGQKAAVLAVMEARRPEAEALARRSFSDMEAFRDSVGQDIRKLLRPDQAVKFDAMAERMKRRRRRFGPPE